MRAAVLLLRRGLQISSVLFYVDPLKFAALRYGLGEGGLGIKGELWEAPGSGMEGQEVEMNSNI